MRTFIKCENERLSVSLSGLCCFDCSHNFMVLPVGLISKHGSRMQTQRTSLELCVQGTN